MNSYVWEDAVTGKIVVINRPISQYTDEPDYEEAVGSGIMTEDEFRETEWSRLMRHPDDTKSHRTYIRPSDGKWDTPGDWSR